MTFSLTEAGRENLEAILAEFERAARSYPPLYHQRMIPWSIDGEVEINDAQWETFINAESNSLDDSEWWEWDGPHSAKPGMNSTYLGMWYGNPEGLQEFINLVESAMIILEREDFSDVDANELPFAFGSLSQWISTLHMWAFRFHMPLLRIDMTPWGASDSDPDDYFELVEQKGKVGDSSYPLHPFCWKLVDNVFTSSMEAIRAILKPDMVIATNEPWPLSSSYISLGRIEENYEETLSETEQAEAHEKRVETHRLIEGGPGGWTIVPAQTDIPMTSKHQAGLHRIAILIEHKGRQFSPEELYKYGARTSLSYGKTVERTENTYEHGMTERTSLSSSYKEEGQENLSEVGEEIGMLFVERNEAERREDTSDYDRVDALIKEMEKIYVLGKDGSVKRRRIVRSKEKKAAYDTVAATIKSTIRDVTDQSSQLGAELSDQIIFPDLEFRPIKNNTEWEVRRIK